MFWNDANDIVRVLVVTPLAYAALIVILRVSGKRMLSKMSAFDLVVTIALGSTLATMMLSKDVALAEGVLALTLLIGLQYAVAWSAARSKRVRAIMTSAPALLYYQGEFLPDALRNENVPEDAVRAGIRQQGYLNMDEVGAVVLETDGSLSIIRRNPATKPTTLSDIRNPPRTSDPQAAAQPDRS